MPPRSPSRPEGEQERDPGRPATQPPPAPEPHLLAFRAAGGRPRVWRGPGGPELGPADGAADAATAAGKDKRGGRMPPPPGLPAGGSCRRGQAKGTSPAGCGRRLFDRGFARPMPGPAGHPGGGLADQRSRQPGRMPGGRSGRIGYGFTGDADRRGGPSATVRVEHALWAVVVQKYRVRQRFDSLR